jgi:hypothetical protein
MSKYLLRNIGWPHNDSTYEFDGEQQVVEIFDTKEEAIQRRDYLNREYLLYNLNCIERFEAWGENYQKHFEKVNNLLVSQFGFNPSVALYSYFASNYSIFMFWERPDDKSLDQLVELFGVKFFSIIEIPAEDHVHLFTARINEVYTNYPDDYLMDYHGAQNMYFANHMDAYERFISELEHELYDIKSNGNLILKGSIEDLTNLPHIFSSVVDESEHLKYENNALTIDCNVDAQTFSKLNPLLKNPILLFEKEPLKEMEVFDQTFIDEIIQSNQEDWETIEDRNAKYSSKEAYYKSEEFLLSFSFPLRIGYYNQNTHTYQIVKNYLLQHFPETDIITHSRFRYKDGIPIEFYGVISKTTQVDTLISVESLFWTNLGKTIDLRKKAKGIGQTLHEAFENSLDQWLARYTKDLVPIIKGE